MPPPNLGAAPATRRGTQSLERAIGLLRELSTRLTGGWTLTELATQCGLDRGTAHRMLDCLIREGLVIRQPLNRGYLLGPLAFELGLAASARFDPRTACGPSLRLLVERSGETAFLNLRSGRDTVCVDRSDGPQTLKALAVEIGARRSLVASAAGVAILMALPAAERRVLTQSSLAHLRRADAAHRAGIGRMLRESEAAGYAVNRDHIIPGITAIAVPIGDRDGRPVAALTLAGISQRLNERRCGKLIGILAAEAEKIAARWSAQAS
ncbi:MAG: IclR family transcriptional regulator [Burkholderiaceae bacterium]